MNDIPFSRWFVPGLAGQKRDSFHKYRLYVKDRGGLAAATAYATDPATAAYACHELLQLKQGWTDYSVEGFVRVLRQFDQNGMEKDMGEVPYDDPVLRQVPRCEKKVVRVPEPTTEMGFMAEVPKGRKGEV